MGGDTCPTFLHYRFHRYPCTKAGEIEDLSEATTTDPEGDNN